MYWEKEALILSRKLPPPKRKYELGVGEHSEFALLPC
jgi:hypothetical protein